MEVKVLATGSTGNVTAVFADETFLLLDCGKPYKWIVGENDFMLPDAVFITHEHGDHAKAAGDFLKRGVDIFLTRGTAHALKLRRHNLHTISAGDLIQVKDISVTAIKAHHDAAEPVNFILQDKIDRVLFVTDTGKIPDVDGDFSKIFIEANYREEILREADLSENQKQRIFENHLSFEQAQKFLAKYQLAEVTLIHKSKRHF